MSTLNSQKYALSLHTSSSQLGLSLSNFAGDSRCQTWDLDRELSIYLHSYLREFIKPKTWQDLEFLVVAKGPGSFTSSRIGVVTARTMAQQLGIPLFSISSLAALAWSKKDEFPNQLIAIQMEATRGQLYGGIYQIKESKLLTYLPDTLMTSEIWQDNLEQLEMPYKVLEASANLGITAISLLELAEQEWQQGNHPTWEDALPFCDVLPSQLGC